MFDLYSRKEYFNEMTGIAITIKGQYDVEWLDLSTIRFLSIRSTNRVVCLKMLSSSAALEVLYLNDTRPTDIPVLRDKFPKLRSIYTNLTLRSGLIKERDELLGIRVHNIRDASPLGTEERVNGDIYFNNHQTQLETFYGTGVLHIFDTVKKTKCGDESIYFYKQQIAPDFHFTRLIKQDVVKLVVVKPHTLDMLEVCRFNNLEALHIENNIGVIDLKFIPRSIKHLILINVNVINLSKIENLPKLKVLRVNYSLLENQNTLVKQLMDQNVEIKVV